MTLSTFGDVEHPVHASRVPTLMSCPWRLAMEHLALKADTGREAADTGSAVHKAIEAWHAGADVAGAIAAMREGLRDYPLADFREAELHFRPYTQDPRNREAKVVLAEAHIAFEWAGVHFAGRLDQVRLHGSELVTVDFKTGSPEGYEMQAAAAYQQACYSVGASLKLGKTVRPGCVLRTRGYRKRGVDRFDPPGVFWWYTLSAEDAWRMVKDAASQALRVRAGDVWAVPGKQCDWCPAKGFMNCVPRLARFKES